MGKKILFWLFFQATDGAAVGDVKATERRKDLLDGNRVHAYSFVSDGGSFFIQVIQ